MIISREGKSPCIFFSQFPAVPFHAERSLARSLFFLFPPQKNFYIPPEIFILYFATAPGHVVERGEFVFLIGKFICCCVLHTRATMIQEYYTILRPQHARHSITFSPGGMPGVMVRCRYRMTVIPKRFWERESLAWFSRAARGAN